MIRILLDYLWLWLYMQRMRVILSPVIVPINPCSLIFAIGLQWVKLNVSRAEYILPLALKLLYRGRLLAYHHHQSRFLLHYLFVAQTYSLIRYLFKLDCLLLEELLFFVIVMLLLLFD